MKVYIAGPFFSPTQLQKVEKIEALLTGMGVEFFSPRSFGVLKDMTQAERDRRMEEIYLMNVGMVRDCNVTLVITDEKDTGTLFELGYAACLKEKVDHEKFIVTVSLENKPANLMLRFCLDAHCISYDQICDVMSDIRNKGYVAPENKNFPLVNT